MKEYLAIFLALVAGYLFRLGLDKCGERLHRRRIRKALDAAAFSILEASKRLEQESDRLR